MTKQSTASDSPYLNLPLDDARIATPVPVVDLAKLTANIEEAKARAKRLGVTLRPHLKTHKSLAIARRQMERPEGPATVSTLLEAERFAAAGVRDLIYGVGIAPQKLPKVAEIRRSGCDLKILVDSVEAAEMVSDFCADKSETVPVLIEVDVDGHRSGVRPKVPCSLRSLRPFKAAHNLRAF